MVNTSVSAPCLLSTWSSRAPVWSLWLDLNGALFRALCPVSGSVPSDPAPASVVSSIVEPIANPAGPRLASQRLSVDPNVPLIRERAWQHPATSAPVPRRPVYCRYDYRVPTTAVMEHGSDGNFSPEPTCCDYHRTRQTELQGMGQGQGGAWTNEVTQGGRWDFASRKPISSLLPCEGR